jgi:UDP-glucose 4-epimerase
MTRALAWVVGEGGLLGSAVCRVLAELPGIRRYSASRLPWGDPARLETALDAAARAFAREAIAARAPWWLLWCAGAGVVASDVAALTAETQALQTLLDRVAVHLADPRPQLGGRVFLASSAGGIYGSNPDQPLTEASAPAPISEYGVNKLRQEELLRRWARERPHVAWLAGRLSNLYGPGQNLEKPQGLISHVSRCLIHHVPVHVYVPLDTLRDYLYAGDAARAVVSSMAFGESGGWQGGLVKIFASGQPCSVARIIGTFARIAKRQPRVISAASAAARRQPAKLCLKSTVEAGPPLARHTDLPAGIHAVYEDQLRAFREGRLPAPPRA